MNYREAIKRGITTVNTNYKLLFIQTGILVIAFLLFLLVVGTPVIIVFAKSGLDLPEEGFKDILKNILKVGLRDYLTLIITIMLSLLIYLVIASVIFIYTLAGTSGVLMSYIAKKEVYSWVLFHSYGKRFFKKFLLLSITGLITLMVLSFVAGIISGLTKSAAPVSEDFIKEFFTNFFYLLSILLSLGMVILFMAIFTYAAGILLLNESITSSVKGVFEALKGALKFIIRKPESLVFYSILSIAAIILTMIFGIIGTSFKGPGGFVLYQLLLSIVQIYINLSVISCAFVYLKESF
ncbi:MAG: hypothetical protein N2257_01255 [Thermodesulfovibrionales bacterium]|nr:hypothetical protein [Thermodesulfovibrionales bacterium]